MVIMRVEIGNSNGEIIFSFTAEAEDNLSPTPKFSFGKSTVRIKLEGVEIEEIHPDLVALSVILMCHPFVGKELHLPFSVSGEFKKTVASVISRYQLIFDTEREVDARKINDNFRMGLAFSGGVDSTAALAVMPKDSVPVFMLRPQTEKSLYNPDAAIKACNSLTEIGYDARIVICDVEYLRDPVGFPTDLSHAIPAILLADELMIDSISFGTVLESAFGIGHEEFRDYGNGAHWRFYGSLFRSAGVELSLPVSGVSEVGTAIITEKSHVGDFSQSCIRGNWKSPCMKCWKCFRKGLLNSALGNGMIESSEMGDIIPSNEIRSKLSSKPISHENVLEYSLQRIKIGQNKFLGLLKNRVDRDSHLDFLECWYSPSLEFVPKKYRREIRENIFNYLNPMSDEDLLLVSDWNIREFIDSEDVKDFSKDLDNEIQSMNGRKNR